MTDDLITRLRETRLLSQRNQLALQAEAAAEIQKLNATLEKVRRSALTLTETQRQIYDHYQAASKINREAVGTLDSERECNALLTAEVEALRGHADAMAEVLHQCTAVLTANDCASVSKVLIAYRTAFPEPRHD